MMSAEETRSDFDGRPVYRDWEPWDHDGTDMKVLSSDGYVLHIASKQLSRES